MAAGGDSRLPDGYRVRVTLEPQPPLTPGTQVTDVVAPATEYSFDGLAPGPYRVTYAMTPPSGAPELALASSSTAVHNLTLLALEHQRGDFGFDPPPAPVNAPALELLVNGQTWDTTTQQAPIEWVTLKEMTFDVRATDPDAGDSLGLSGTLDGVSLDTVGSPTTFGPPDGTNPTTRAFSWTPQAADTGVRELVFMATDGIHTTEYRVSFEIVNDADGDALPDRWEQEQGYWTDGAGGNDGGVWVPLTGADPNRIDIFVYMDYMQKTVPDGPGVEDPVPLHSHRPSDEAMELVRQAFARQDIALHLIVAPEGIEETPDSRVLGVVNQVPENPTQSLYDWSEFDAIKRNSLPAGFEASHHYCLWAHQVPEAYGIARQTPGSEFVVSLWDAMFDPDTGTVKTLAPHVEASAFMHELGHDLGLRHGGDEEVSYKPNYLSVMNYLYGHNGLIRDDAVGFVDYSDGSRPSLDESAMVESDGLGLASLSYGVRWLLGEDFLDPELFRDDTDGSKDVDWNGDGEVSEQPMPADVNGDGMMTVLKDNDDWRSLRYSGGSMGQRLRPPGPRFSVFESISWTRANVGAPTGQTPPATDVSSVPPQVQGDATGAFVGLLGGFVASDPDGLYPLDVLVSINGAPDVVLPRFVTTEGPFEIPFGVSINGEAPVLPGLGPGVNQVRVTLRNRALVRRTTNVAIEVAPASPTTARGEKTKIRDRLMALLPTGDTQADRRLRRAVRHLDRSLAPSLWIDDDTLSARGRIVFERDRRAVRDLLRIQDHVDVGDAVQRLVQIDASLARAAVEDVPEGAGVLLAIARFMLAKADCAAAEGEPMVALSAYGGAWQMARAAAKWAAHPWHCWWMRR